ncbi:hypothetical protein BAUCODRAFT_378039 [Baudoinia panamericana UAMH 10762]|uniref:Uncharacterized protein n=1 Tax=Baudoinia panamericana (strain UAMH 10762) TaxID=717646 RepID=M2NHY7_BAUPA|nr:uncharacterized protein BAUCODRAFT_378039 [Baudoinia panamericana UAMH 10762]EMC98690.1 hypothetical protein BAUCODRAFT_378039 [Baudoinia panamericana UAMH 10762]
MGVVVSSTSTTSPFFLTSGIIGFVSFAFTVGTFLRVLWVNIMTLGEAPHEVHSFLTNLRTELQEERASLKVMRKVCKRRQRLAERGGTYARLDNGLDLDDVTIKTMSDAIKHLIKQFRDIEKPFLEPGDHGIEEGTKRRKRRRSSRSISPYAHSPYNSPPEKAYARSRTDHDRLPRYADERGYEDDDDDRYWAQRTRYAHYSFWKRLAWISKKPQAQNLFSVLSRVQTRRIARQVGGLSYIITEYGNSAIETEEMVRRIDERMNRFVGVRRADE